MLRPAPIFSSLRSRPFAVALLVYQFFFFNIVLPGHTRGIITLDGKHTASCCSSCCSSGSAHPGKGDSNHPPSPRDRENCAICSFAARVTLPPTTDFTLARLGLSEILDVPAPMAAPSIRLPSSLHDRAPPFMA